MNFRLYNKRENFHIYDCEYFVNKKRDIVFQYRDECSSCYISIGREYAIQYSTGLKDINGVEIFEGDRICWAENDRETREAQVVYSPKVAAFVLDIHGRHLFDSKYGDYQHLHYQTKYTIK
jgi:hypothetical protein